MAGQFRRRRHHAHQAVARVQEAVQHGRIRAEQLARVMSAAPVLRQERPLQVDTDNARIVTGGRYGAADRGGHVVRIGGDQRHHGRGGAVPAVCPHRASDRRRAVVEAHGGAAVHVQVHQPRKQVAARQRHPIGPAEHAARQRAQPAPRRLVLKHGHDGAVCDQHRRARARGLRGDDRGAGQ